MSRMALSRGNDVTVNLIKERYLVSATSFDNRNTVAGKFYAGNAFE